MDLEARDDSGRTAALVALRQGNLTCLRLLVEAGARLDVVYKQGNILHIAAVYSNASTLQYLRSQNVEVSWVLGVGNQSWTAWHCLRDCMTFTDSELSDTGWRRPSVVEAHEFALLYSEVRDRCLQKELGFLEEVMEALARRDGDAATKCLKPLMEYMSAMGWDWPYEIYWVVVLQIKDRCGMLQLKRSKERVDVCQVDMRTSPWRYWPSFDDKPDQEDYSEVYKQFDELLVEKYGDKAVLFYDNEINEETDTAEEWHEAQEEVASTDEELESDEE